MNFVNFLLVLTFEKIYDKIERMKESARIIYFEKTTKKDFIRFFEP